MWYNQLEEHEKNNHIGQYEQQLWYDGIIMKKIYPIHSHITYKPSAFWIFTSERENKYIIKCGTLSQEEEVMKESGGK